MARKVQEVDELPDGLVGEVESAVRRSGAVPLRALTRVALSRRAAGLLHEGLARRGLERTGKAVRVPVRGQVLAAAAHGPIAIAVLRKQVRGLASSGELALALADLVRSGRAALVMREGVEHVAAPSPEVLDAGEVAALRDLSLALVRAAGSLRAREGRPPRSLWRADILALLDRARATLGSGAAADPVALVVDAVRRHASPTTGLAPVPAIARSLRPRLPDVRQALLAAAAAGLVELRPDSGVNPLAPADAELCPRGPDGWPLSWARELAGEGA